MHTFDPVVLFLNMKKYRVLTWFPKSPSCDIQLKQLNVNKKKSVTDTVTNDNS